MDMCDRRLIVEELFNVEVVIVLLFELVFIFLPDRSHRVERFDSLVYLRLVAVVVIVGMLYLHSDRESDIIGILLDERLYLHLVEVS